MNEMLTAISVFSTLCAIVFGYAAFNRNRKKDDSEDGEESGRVLTEIGYIKSGIDDIKRKQDRQDELYAKMAERVAAVEASAKQAHKRIDRIENITDRPE